MRIVLQQPETGLYFKDIAQWVGNGQEAMDFVSSTAAIEFCAANKLKDLQIVLKFDEERCDIVLPLQGAEATHGAQPSHPA
ncbi:MAG TPA: hypothetical protein VMU04_16005 [Candidatus Acidoferrum sp.]|nr:hypothetical protein [Candidatus Acidoferrum sp.]